MSRNEMDPSLCGSTAMSHNGFTIREPIKPQEASPMKQEMNVLGIDIAKRVFHAVGMDDRGNVVVRKRKVFHMCWTPQRARPNSYRFMKRPITRSCICSVLEKHSVRRTKRLIRVRRLMCLLSIFWVFSFPT